VVRIDKFDLSIDQLATLGASVKMIASDALAVYVTSDDGGVFRIAVAGGEPQLLATGDSPRGLAIDATHVYWADVGSKRSTIMKVPKLGGTAVHLADDDEGSWRVALDADCVYWTNPYTRRLWKAPK
jgi:hypothetical protein